MEEKRTTWWHLPFCYLALLPCTEPGLLLSSLLAEEENQQFPESPWIFHVLIKNASSGTLTFNYTFRSWILVLKLLGSFSFPFGNIIPSDKGFLFLILQNCISMISSICLLQRMPGSNNLDIKGGRCYTQTTCEKKHFWNAQFRLQNSQGWQF